MTKLDDLISQLPEIYQPIFGHNEIAGRRSGHQHRFDVAKDLAHSIASDLGRPLRILDFGSAQGFLALDLATAGHSIVGIDHAEENIQLSQYLAQENPSLAVAFLHGDTALLTEVIDDQQFDLITFFSVLHHAIHRDGFQQIFELMTFVADHVPNCISELALREEALYWSDSLEQEPRKILSMFPFLRKVGSSPTHLSSVVRPIFFCSSQVALFAGKCHPIRKYSTKSHSLTPANYTHKRYFETSEYLVKICANFQSTSPQFLLEAGHNDLRNEAHQIARLGHSIADQIHVAEISESADETLLARSLLPGIPLSEVGEGLDQVTRDLIIDQVLDQLMLLETLGSYHNDLRQWNVLWDQELSSARLIDLGAISESPVDGVFPFDARYSFFLFCWGIWAGASDQTGLTVIRAPRESLFALKREQIQKLSLIALETSTGNFFRNIFQAWRTVTSDPMGLTIAEIPAIFDWFLKVIEHHDSLVGEDFNAPNKPS